jgi:hypothetical protein
MHAIDVFVVVSGSFAILTSVPLVYLAYRSFRDARELHRLQRELHRLQHELHTDQRRARHDIVRTKETVERVEAATRRRRLPRVRVEVER